MSSPAPVVSVVAATHDRAARLDALLRSLAAQSLSREAFEVVVVDDASVDPEVARVLDQHRGSGRLRLRVIRRESSAGPAAARNDGWRAVAAPLVAFTDDDCVAAPDWLSEGLSVHRRNPAAVVQGRTDPIPEESHRLGPLSRTQRVDKLGPYYQTCNIFYPRDLLDAVGGFDAEAFRYPGGEDTDLAWKAIDRGNETIFAPRARVFHAVNHLGVRGQLRIAARWGHTMEVYARHPELRRRVFMRGVFWKPAHYLLARALLALLVPRRLRILRLWLAQPYIWHLYVRAHYEGTDLRYAPFFALYDLVETLAVARAGVRHRTPML